MPTNALRVLAATAIIVGAALRAGEDEFAHVPWQPLENGRDLTGWSVAAEGGGGTFAWRDGAIVGTTRRGAPIAYLRTTRMYGDFVLEGEFLVPAGVNAGLQFRSHAFRRYRGGAFHGYQFEVSGAPGGHGTRRTGGIFDESRRGWIGPVMNRSAAEEPCVAGEWNHVRLVAVGDRIRTWVNGVPVLEMRDGMTPAGYIALQLHDSRHRTGDEVQWRNLRIKDLDRTRPASPEGRYAEFWKGACSEASLGLYARVVRGPSGYEAQISETRDFQGPPLAVLSGAGDGDELVLRAAGWEAHVTPGRIWGRGQLRGVRLVHTQVERTVDLVAVDFELMPGR